jgi:hypothetical protein
MFTIDLRSPSRAIVAKRSSGDIVLLSTTLVEEEGLVAILVVVSDTRLMQG